MDNIDDSILDIEDKDAAEIRWTYGQNAKQQAYGSFMFNELNKGGYDQIPPCGKPFVQWKWRPQNAAESTYTKQKIDNINSDVDETIGEQQQEAEDP